MLIVGKSRNCLHLFIRERMMCSLLFSCIRKNIICELPEIKFRDQRQATSIFSEQLPHVNISSKQRWRHLASQFNGRRKGA